MESVEHRVAISPGERAAAYRLRYDAYLRNGLLAARADHRLHDQRYDDAPDTWVSLTYVDGELAGTARISFGADCDALLPSLRVYPEVIAPRLALGRSIVEFTRLAAKLEFSQTYPELAYLIMRPAYLAAEHFGADYAVASPRAEHMAFYRRVFGGEQWCAPRPYPGLTALFGCMGADFRAAQAGVEARYPFFRSPPAEREALFGPRLAEPRRSERTLDNRRRVAENTLA